MYRRHRGAEVSPDERRFSRRERAIREHLFQRPSADKLHPQADSIVDPFRSIDGDDVRMLDSGEELTLVDDRWGGVCSRRGLGRQQFQRHFAVQSGVLAGEAVAEARAAKDLSKGSLARYRRKLDASFVLQDLKAFRRAPELFHIERLYEDYPEIACDFFERMYRVDGQPKEPLGRMAMKLAKKKVGVGSLLRDAFTAWRAT